MTDSSSTDKGSPDARGAVGGASGGASSGLPGSSGEGKSVGAKSLRQPPTINLKATGSSIVEPASPVQPSPPPGQVSGVDVSARTAGTASPAQGGAAGGQTEPAKMQTASAATGGFARKQDAPGPGGGSSGDGNAGARIDGASAASPPGRAGLGFAGGLLAAMIGGAAGVAGAWAVSVIHPGSIATIQQDGSLEQRISAVEQDLSVRMTTLAPKAEVETLAEKVAALNGQVTTLASEARDLAARAAAAPSPAAEPGQADNTVAADASLRTQLAALGERLTAAEQAAQRAGALANEVGGQVKALDGVVRNIDLSAAQGAARTAGEAVRRIDGLDGRIAELGRSIAAKNTDPRVSDLARAIAATDVLAAIRSGRAFRQETAAVAAAGGDARAAPLLSAGAGGVATLSQLQHDFAGVRDRLAAMQHQNEGVLDRLTASASRLVRVRPVDREGKPVAAAEGTVERVGDLLAAGDLVGAAVAWGALPQDMRNLAPEFGAALAARVNAEQAARGALDAALASVARHGADAGAVQPAQGRGQ